MKGTISRVLEVVSAFIGLEAVDEAGNCAPKVIEVSFGRFAEQRFELSEGLLDRV